MRNRWDNPAPLIECTQVHEGGTAHVDADITISPTFNTGQHTHIHLHLTIMDNEQGLIGKLKALLSPYGKSHTAIVTPQQAVELIESSMKEVKRNAKQQATDVPTLPASN